MDDPETDRVNNAVFQQNRRTRAQPERYLVIIMWCGGVRERKKQHPVTLFIALRCSRSFLTRTATSIKETYSSVNAPSAPLKTGVWRWEEATGAYCM